MLKLKTLLNSAVLLSFSSLSYGSMVYSLVDLGALDANSDYSMAAGINNAGTVAGISLNNFAQQVFIYDYTIIYRRITIDLVQNGVKACCS